MTRRPKGAQMGVRSRIHSGLTRAARAFGPADVAKAFGSAVPQQIEAAEAQSQMTPASPFSPGEPIGPYDGYSRTPRSRDFVTGYNIATRPRTHEAVAFETLKGLIRSYDVAQICCIPGTEVITKRGLVPIEDVLVGDEVITHLGRWRRVTETMVNRPHTPVRTLKTSAFENLSVTGNHPVYAVDFRVTQSRSREARGIGWVSADELRPRGPLVSHSYDGLVLPALDLPDGCPELDVAAIAGDQFTVSGEGMLARRRGGRFHPVPARVRMDAALGRLLGWYMAEGSQAKGREVFFTLGPAEQAYGEQILADAEAVFGLRGRVTPQAAHGSGFHVRVASSVLASLFSCGKAINKRLPEWAWAGGREFFTALLEGWTLGDGCRIERNGWSPRIEVATSSRDLAWQMRMVAISLGLGASVVTMRNRDKYNAVINGKRLNSQPIAYHVAWTEKPRRWTRESFEFDGRYLATALVSAEPSDYDGPVYNLEVEEDESYVTTGGTVHNCIRHRIASLRSLEYKLVAADHYDGDVASEVAEGARVLHRPDGKTLFKPWLAKYLRGVLSYDAGTLYRMRNRGGRAVGLKVVDGTTIAPLLDYWGDQPESPAPAYVQYVNGLPWNWLTSDDVIYQPYDPQDDSLYGRAPIEDVLLNANTDLRFQIYFLQRFTEGNMPAAFASAPESWSPEQIEQFQELWDSFMLGDQSRKSQIRWLPGGSKFAWSNEKDFTDEFSLFLMRKTCASFCVVPADLGFTESVNRSSGESQADVQHRVGDLPLAHHVQDILSAFLQDDLGLPLKFSFDLGEEQDDRVAQAQADEIYWRIGSAGSSEIREWRYGRSDPVPIPRSVFTERAGPIPIAALLAVAGEIDPATGLPAPGAELPHEVFGGTEGVLPNPPIKVPSLAEQEFGPAAMPPAPPPQPKMTAADVTPDLAAPVAKDGEGAAATAGAEPGITSDTGVYSYDLVREDEDEDEAPVAKRFLTVDEARQAGREARERELTVFRRFSRARRKAGQWRDFTFEYHSAAEAQELNRAAMVGVAKAAGEIAVAGLAVLAADTGRVLMLQRALCDDDPAAGTWEMPGGHLEAGETPLRAAWREWSEETGCVPPPGVQTGSWTSPDGIYQGIVWTVDSEASVPVRCDTEIGNPDDPDGDQVEAIAWWDPATLPGNPVVRPELLASIDTVMAALGCALPDDSEAVEKCAFCPACGGDLDDSGRCMDLLDYGEKARQRLGIDGTWGDAQDVPHPFDGHGHGCCALCLLAPDAVAHHGPGAVAKAGGGGPKGRDWPGWKLDLRAAAHWAPQVSAAAQQALPEAKLRELGAAYIADHPGQDGSAPGKRDRNKAASGWLAAWLAKHGVTLVPAGIGQGIAADGYLIGAASAAAMVNGEPADTGGWNPGDGDKARERIEVLGLGAVLAAALAGGGDAAAVAAGVASGYVGSLAIILAGADGEWAESGELLDELGGLLSDALADDDTAVTLVGTEITTYSGLAASDYYLANTTSLLRWVTEHDAKVCARCLENEAADPVRAGQAFPSGDVTPPAHNRCRCAIVPDWA